jgi:hypothetical protein
LKDDSEGDKYLKWSVGLLTLCVPRLLEDDTPVLKNVGYLKWSVGLAIFCVPRLLEDGTPVPKHVVVGTYNELFYDF